MIFSEEKGFQLHELEEVRNELSQMQELVHSLRLVNSTLDLPLVLDYLLGIATQITDCEAASIILREGGRFYFAAATGKNSGELKRVSLDENEGIAGWVFQQGKSLIIRDALKDSRFSKKADRVSGIDTRSVLAVPLRADNDIIGVIEAVNKKGKGQFNSDDERHLTLLADSTALSIHKTRLLADLKNLFLSTIKAFVRTIEAKDPYTRGHSERIRTIALSIADEYGITPQQRTTLEIGALLHDIGKIGIREDVLGKRERLTPEEYIEMQKHPTIGAQMLADIPQLADELPIIRHHQERYDGTGYPDRLIGEQIPLLARIVSIADSYDAMTTDRPYSHALNADEAVAEIKRCAGTQFDPNLVKPFLRAFEKGSIRKPE